MNIFKNIKDCKNKLELVMFAALYLWFSLVITNSITWYMGFCRSIGKFFHVGWKSVSVTIIFLLFIALAFYNSDDKEQ